jgi:hypothetical protein
VRRVLCWIMVAVCIFFVLGNLGSAWVFFYGLAAVFFGFVAVTGRPRPRGISGSRKKGIRK